MNLFLSVTCIFIWALFPPQLRGQQVVDSAFQVPEFIPAFKRTEGPVILVDMYHNNLGVEQGNYNPFFSLLEKDGYRIRFVEQEFSGRLLQQGEVLVIINAISKENINKWFLPVFPAFSLQEQESVYNWVMNGGSLLLVADHMPFPAAAESLAERFGAFFTNGFAIDTVHWDPIVFRQSDLTLLKHPVILGRDNTEIIDSVATFWGQAFQTDEKKLDGIFRFADHVVSFNPDTAWRFRKHTPVVPVKNWLQAAGGEFGKGRVIILGEAGMLTAQLTGPNRTKVGINSAEGKQNFQFILNALRWLSFNYPEDK
jgi:hypothetical protein